MDSLADGVHFQIVATLGFDKITTYLVQAPPPIIAFLVTLAVSWSSGRMLELGWHIVIPMALTGVGCAVMITTLNVGARYFCMILLVTGPFIGLNVSLLLSHVIESAADYHIASDLLGDHRRSATQDEARGSDCLRKLRLLRLSLVHPLLLPA
jgi:hypothetical protein